MINLAESPERSIVTVLSVDTVDSTGHIARADPDEAQELLDRVFARLEGAVRGAGGMFVNYSGDGGLAVFGWPDSVEDHADRACEAAWAIQNPPESQKLKDAEGRPIQFRVGVHSGLVGLRRMSFGGADRLDPVGSTVYIAAALQKRATTGDILLSSKTLELCQSDMELAASDDLPFLRQISAKAFRLLAQPPGAPLRHAHALSYRIPLIGRVQEREVIRNMLLKAGDGKRAIAVIGEPGIGKSRLMAAAMQDAHAAGVSGLAFHGDSRKRTTPFSAMRALILNTLSLSDMSSDEEIIRALRTAGIDDPQETPLATVLLVTRTEKGSASRSPTQTQVARALVESLARLLEGSLKLILIEDLHFVDLESQHCLRLLAEEKSGCCALLLTGRPEAAADAMRIVDVVTRLEALPREDMRRLGRALWPHGSPPPAMLEAALDRADGVPFILEQIVLSAGVDGSESIDLAPQRVQSVIHARLNRLSPSAKGCAQALSVLGEEVELEIVLEVLACESPTLQRDCRELELLEIIHPLVGPTIRFRHAVVAEAIAETLPRPRRVEIHNAAIGAITSLYADLGAQYERLASHAEGARDNERALEYLWLAGLRARRSSANESLFLIFQRAMSFIERSGQPAEARFVDFVLMACAQLLQIGEFSKMKPYLPRALELAQNQKRQDRVCAALCNMGTVSWFEGRYADSRDQCERGLEIAESLSSLPLIFAAKFMLASALWGMADMNRAIALQHELRETFAGKLETARLGAIAIPSSMVRSYLSWFMMEVGRYDEGLSYAEQALEIAIRAGEPYSEMLARNGLGRNLLKLNRHREAVDCLEIAISLIDQYGYDAIRPHVIGQFASALARAGQAPRAVRMVEAWLADGLEARTGRLELYYLHAGYAEALLCSEKQREALAAAERALEIARSLANPCLIVQGLGLHARVLSDVCPGAADIERDLAEQAELCSDHGLVAEAWQGRRL